MTEELNDLLREIEKSPNLDKLLHAYSLFRRMNKNATKIQWLIFSIVDREFERCWRIFNEGRKIIWKRCITNNIFPLLNKIRNANLLLWAKVVFRHRGTLVAFHLYGIISAVVKTIISAVVKTKDKADLDTITFEVSVLNRMLQYERFWKQTYSHIDYSHMQTGDRKILQHLTEIVRNKEMYTQNQKEETLWCIGRYIGGPTVIPLLLDTLNDPDIQHFALSALRCNIDEKIIDPLIKFLEMQISTLYKKDTKPDIDLINFPIAILGRSQDERAKPVLTMLAKQTLKFPALSMGDTLDIKRDARAALKEIED